VRAKLVIFDFDGTIADSRGAIAHCANAALEAVGRPAVPAAAIQTLIGLPLGDIFERLIHGATSITREDDLHEVIDAAVVAYRERYPDIDRAHSRVYDEMPELLAELRDAGARLAIATGKSTSGAHRALERLGMSGDLFAAILGNDAVARPKPHPDMVVAILETLGERADAAVVVGDTTFDVEMSVSAEVPSCGVTWGSHTEAALRRAGATWIAATRPELRRLLLA
jgi:phosphoglycolate phosphatase